MTLPEAMAYGKVVIASEGTGSSMLIQNGKNGFIFPSRNVNVLIMRLSELKRSFNDFKYMGVEARKTAETVTWEKVKNRYVDLYKELLE